MKWTMEEGREPVQLNIVYNGINSCLDLEIKTGQTIGEAVGLSPCKCEFCRTIRSEVEQDQ